MMTGALALAVLLLSAPGPQEDLERKIEGLLPGLSDDWIEVRNQAVRSLVDLGPSVLPLLRKRARELGAETQGRLLEACAQIESRNTLAKYLPPLRRVQLDWENRPAREALEELGRRIGLSIDTSNAPLDGAISFSLREATPLEALDDVCRRAGVTWRSSDDDLFGGRRRPVAPRDAPRVLIQNGKAPEFPTAYVRQYRIRVTQLALTRTNTFQGQQSTAQMNLDLGWTPGAKPDGLHSFRITEMKDDQGRSLLLDEDDRGRGRFRAPRNRWRGRDAGGYSQFLMFKFPEADARSIAVLKGTSVFSFPQEVRTVVFEKAAEAPGKSIDLSGLAITLKEFQPKGTGVSVTLEMSGRFKGAAGADDGDDDGFGALPFSFEDVEVVTESGDPLRSQSMSARGDGKTYTWQLDFEGAKASPAKELRIHCILRHFNDEANFEIKDISLPR